MLDKNDLKQIEKMFDRFQANIKNQIELSEKRVKLELKKDIFGVEEKLESKSEAAKNEIITTISREIGDLAKINREVIKRVDLIGELDKRLTRLEAKFASKPF